MNSENDKGLESTEFGAQDVQARVLNSANAQAVPAIKRRSLWVNVREFVQYIASIYRKQFRKSDKVSDGLVVICLFFAAILIVSPPTFLKPPIILISSIFFLAVILFFIINRIGIITSLSPRQAILVCDIILGALILGILLGLIILYCILVLVPK